MEKKQVIREADKVKLEHVESMVSVTYEGRVAYVPEDKLLPMSDQYIDHDSEEPALRIGYAQVQVDGEVHIVKDEDIYTKVVPHAGIAGGLAAETPRGLIAATPTHKDDAGTLYVCGL